MKYNSTGRIFSIFLFFELLVMVALPLAVRAKTIKILIMPFHIKANQNYTFLQKGIAQMLNSRLDVPDKSIPVIPGTSEADTADDTLKGTISILGNSVNTSAELVNTKTGRLIFTFKKTGKLKSDVIMHINLLARQIKTDVLHIKPEFAPLPGELTDNGGHTKVVTSKKRSSWSSRAFDHRFISLCVADVMGDSKNDTIVASEKKVYIYLRYGNTLKEIGEFKAVANTKILSVDAGDINNNKRAEIYVTCIDQNTNRPASFIMEWTGKKFKRLADHQNWLFRVIKTKTKGTMLLGQIPGSGDSMLDSGVSQLHWKGNKLVAKPLKLPRYVSLYSFTFGDVMNNGSDMLVVLTMTGKIEIYNSAGKRLWRSKKDYGGSDSYIAYEGDFYTGDYNFEMSRMYIQQRIFISDFGHRGKNSVFVVKNYDIASSLLANTRFFIKSYIESFTWDKTGLVLKGWTQPFSGYIADYTIADQDNDGKKEIVFSIPFLQEILHDRYTSRLYSISRLASRIHRKNSSSVKETDKTKGGDARTPGVFNEL